MVNMIGKEAKSDGTVPLHVVWDILESRRKQREPVYEQQIALEHAEKFKITEAQFHKMKKGLDALGVLKDETVIKIADIRPKNAALLKQILMAEKKPFGDDVIAKILAVVNEV